MACMQRLQRRLHRDDGNRCNTHLGIITKGQNFPEESDRVLPKLLRVPNVAIQNLVEWKLVTSLQAVLKLLSPSYYLTSAPKNTKTLQAMHDFLMLILSRHSVQNIWYKINIDKQRNKSIPDCILGLDDFGVYVLQ